MSMGMGMYAWGNSGLHFHHLSFITPRKSLKMNLSLKPRVCFWPRMKMTTMLPPLLLAFCTLSALPALFAFKPSNYSDHQALIAFKSALIVDPFNSLSDWSPNHAFCNWTGISCSPHRQRVVSMNLTGMGLYGPISPFLGNLSFLRILALRNNSLEGHVPYQLVRLFRLSMLGFSHNNLQGYIPSSLGACRSLQSLILSFNKLTGFIPVALSNCTHLQVLSLNMNHLNGPIPWKFERLSELKDVYLWRNQLTGEIPSSVGNWIQLQIMALAMNQLSGTIPSELSLLSNLEIMDLGRNKLTGIIDG